MMMIDDLFDFRPVCRRF